MKQDLRLIPFFTELEEAVIAAIQERCFLSTYPKGEIVFEEGEPGDRMYLIESGQVKVYSEEKGQEKLLSYLGPGSFFGETALLTGEPRNSTVQVMLDAELVVISKRDLEELVRAHPSLGLELSRELGRRLAHQLQEPIEKETYNLVAVIGPRAVELARAIAALTGEEVFLFDLGGLETVPQDATALAQQNVFLARAAETLDESQLADRLGTLVQSYFWIILCLPPKDSPLVRKAIDLVDSTVQISNELGDWLRPVGAKNYLRVPYNPTSMARLARRITERQVGLALSSGNARGFAHIGVLKVLEEEGIPIDMIAATSVGSIFGGLYAAGNSIKELTDFALNIQRQYNFFTGFRYWDFGLPPRTGLLRGRATLEYLRTWFQDRNMTDLDIPLRIIAADCITGEEIVFDSGPIADAVRASISIIGIFEPSRMGNRFLIDGGTVNPVPTSLLVEAGMNIVVASSVIPNLQDRIPRQQARARGQPPNMVNLVLGALEIMESEIIKTRLGGVHVLIQPDVSRYNTLDYEKCLDIVQAGEAAARRELPRLRQLLAPRPRRK